MIPQTLGIDFGTSNTAAGLMVNDAPWLVPVEPGQTTLPTSVFFDYQRKATVYGSVANAALIDGREGRFMRALKSVLGTSLMREKRGIAHERLTLIEVVARFLRTIKERAEASTGLTFTHAVSGRPVHFHSTDRDRDARALVDLRDAYLLAGFKDVQFMYEPEAAALTAGPMEAGTLGLIVDIGGGTSDFSVFARESGTTRIIASHGVRIGGTDFDKALSSTVVMPLLGRGGAIRNDMGSGTYDAPNALFNDLASWEKIPFLYTPETLRLAALYRKQAVAPAPFAHLHDVIEMELGHDVAFAVEQGKIQINKDGIDDARIDLRVIAPALWAPFGRDTLDDVLADHAARIRECAVQTLAVAQVTPAQIGSVVYVGGSSLMRVIETVMTDLIPGAKQERAAAFTAVANGLAMAAQAADAKR